jgi:hypothetical protein
VKVCIDHPKHLALVQCFGTMDVGNGRGCPQFTWVEDGGDGTGSGYDNIKGDGYGDGFSACYGETDGEGFTDGLKSWYTDPGDGISKIDWGKAYDGSNY